ncbi:hypothetical protein [Nocardia brasiliensis]|uniref:hypothetical protein n=1 Tax=Nocardia brasiliensis TaxID=37326 RepID=UPI002455FF65|nr:hypothetical protein [Nocardia brasiliensis]
MRTVIEKFADWFRRCVVDPIIGHTHDAASAAATKHRQTGAIPRHIVTETQHQDQTNTLLAELECSSTINRTGADTLGTARLSEGIKTEDFPFPGRADTFARPLSKSDAAELAERKRFAEWQASAANAGVGRMVALGRQPTASEWRAEYEALIAERAKQGFTRFGHDHTIGKERFTTPITDESPNRDQIGNIGRLRAGSAWSEEAQAWVGGQPTPASRTFEEAGRRARVRFADEGILGDVLQNRVRLTNGQEVDGNRIVTGGTAEQIAQELKAYVAARGVDVSTFETKSSDLSFTITATAADRERILQDACDQLGGPGRLTLETWVDNAYKMLQAPQNKRGSDAIIRTFIAETGFYNLRRVPTFPHDIDLLANTMSQQDFVRHVVDYDAKNR